ncbi:MAG: histidinol dehydrogenase [Bacteroidales bacterium]|nr:histidinol dehydrogenase [Bacteroidales bacterium]
MQILNNPPRAEWPDLTERNIPDDNAIEASVVAIVERVRQEGDAALRDYALQFDGAKLDSLELSDEERKAAAALVSAEVKTAIANAARNIAAFHAAQRPQVVEVDTQNGVHCIQRAVPIQRVGLYIPGGQAPLFSTVLMLGLPAKIAGCKEVVLCTPQGRDGHISPEIIYAAEVCGINHIYRVGGAQAVAAMAYGTDSIPRVDKIFGPGNRYVTKAKQIVSRTTAIDMPAGPSEVLVMADATARPDFVAADMLSQAEHGPDSQAMLVCQTADFAEQVKAEVERQSALLHRASSVEHSLSHSRIIILPTREEMTDFANAYAAEHLIISMAEPWKVAEHITAAGSVFIGNYSPESAGDYASGTNHTLPTSGWARSYSGVNLDSFQRKITYQELSDEGLSALAPTIIAMADAEGLDAHAAAVKVRLGLPLGDAK